MDKGYLRDLSNRGIPVPPTIVIENPSTEALSEVMEEHGWRRAVLKPAIGQSGNGVTLLDMDQIAGWPRQVVGRHVLQPFQAVIRDVGEITLTFIGGDFSHAVLRRPAAGEWRANSQYGVTLEAIQPTRPRWKRRVRHWMHCPARLPMRGWMVLRLPDRALS